MNHGTKFYAVYITQITEQSTFMIDVMADKKKEWKNSFPSYHESHGNISYYITRGYLKEKRQWG